MEFVAATMRDRDHAGDLAGCFTAIVLRLVVLDRASIDAAVLSEVERFESIDILVNDAGYAVLRPLEAIPPASIKRQLATNIMGLIAATQAVMPHLRAKAVAWSSTSRRSSEG